MTVFPATRASALARLHAFLPDVPAYAAQRNHVVPGHTNVSRLSPAIRHRLILEAEVSDAAPGQFSFTLVEKFVQEVWWRTYWRSWLEQRPGVWTDWLSSLEGVRAALSREQNRQIAAIENCNSGIAVIDSFADELITSGYMHNHARMWFASYWCHVARLPWQLGAEFFFRHLLDADSASNTLSWRWVAGLQTRGKSYLVRRSNVEKYLAKAAHTDARGLEQLADTDVSAAAIVDTADLTRSTVTALPDRIVAPQGRWGIWIHDEDLAIEMSSLGSLAPQIVLLTLDIGTLVRANAGPAQRNYKRAAFRDAHSRANAHAAWRAADAVLLRETETLAATLVESAREYSLTTLVAFGPSVGPLRDQLPTIRSQLAENGVKLVLLRRAEDTAVLGLANGGFFPFWQQIRTRLERRAA
jgi:deoxyribodipyrimidine photo-lyase